MKELLFIVGAIFLVEGVLYALFPGAMRRMMLSVVKMPESALQYTGLAAAVIGFFVIYAVKH